ncbi:MAG TPA: penicillin-insensitive murein endopeptidase [Polyangia bacterium]|jgi:penicillin-insensitive murein endopeptidase
MRRVVVLPFLALASCYGPALLTDGTSVSHGAAANGVLRDGAELPMVGDGYQIAPSWRSRHANYGTDEMVEALVRIGRRLARDFPGSEMLLGDLSYLGGRASPRHHSHRNGRDVDVFYFSTDQKGQWLGPYDAMIPFGADGRGRSWRQDRTWHSAPGRYFDDARNWGTVRAFLTDPGIEVQWIFAHDALIRRMLGWATAHQEDPALIARASALMVRPAGALPHDDHMHIRIYCDPGDRPFGCVDVGPVRWMKKQLKYSGSRALAALDAPPAAPAASAAVVRGLPPVVRWIALTPFTPLFSRW